MTEHLKTLREDIFLKTQGYVPAWPSLTELEPGDLLVARPTGGLAKLGNVLDPYFEIQEEVEISTSPKGEEYKTWSFQRGVQQCYTTVIDSEAVGAFLTLKFAGPGDYVFSAQVSERVDIVNFSHVKFKLLQMLASEKFSFKEVYVVTSLAKAKATSLLLATHEAAQAVLAIPANKTGGYVFSDLLKKGIKAEITELEAVDTTYFNEGTELSFFRAMKLEASAEGREATRRYIKEYLPESMQQYAEAIINFAPTQVLPSVYIYPAKVHDLFDFRPLNLQDLRQF